MIGHRANQRRCSSCGREGHLRTMRYTIRDVYVCSQISACARRAAAEDVIDSGNTSTPTRRL